MQLRRHRRILSLLPDVLIIQKFVVEAVKIILSMMLIVVPRY